MKLTYYGTAAGECWPGVFCQCPLCKEARRLGGKNIRTRSQSLVNDDLLLDLPPDNYLHSIYFGLDLSKIQYLLFTHSHSDHCYAPDLEFLREPFSHTFTGPLQIYGNETVERFIQAGAGGLGGEAMRFQYHNVPCNRPFQAGPYTVLPLLATHDRNERCLFYRITQGDKSILYANDTGALSRKNFEAMEEFPARLSLVSMDCTMQRHRDGNYHMGLADAAEQKEILLARGLADEDTIWVVNHFSHNGGWLHDELVREAEKVGFLASYDGMSIEF